MDSRKYFVFCFIILFNGCHVLQLRPETVALRRRMRSGFVNYDGQIVSGDKYDLNFLTFVLHLMENTSTRRLTIPGFESGSAV